MILVDANILVYSFIENSSRHDAARSWLDGRLNGVARVGLPWNSLLAFLRIVTNPRVYARPAPMAAAVKQMADWLGCPNVWTPLPDARHAEILAGLLALPGIHGNLVPDAHLAAIAIEHGLVLCSTDGDFARFPNLQWENPLA